MADGGNEASTYVCMYHTYSINAKFERKETASNLRQDGFLRQIVALHRPDSHFWYLNSQIFAQR